MATLVLRQNLQRKLTVAEVDQNFENLNSDKLERSNNLADLNDAAAARGNLGLGALAVQSDASGVPITDAGGNFTATDVEAALAEEADARQAHEANTANPHSVDASQVPVADSGGNFTATDVEGALGEEADARQAHEAATTGIHGIPGAASIVHTDNLAANGGTVPEEDRANTFQLAQTFQDTPIVQKDDWTGLDIESYRESSNTHVLIKGWAARGTASSPVNLQSGDQAFRIQAGGYEGGTQVPFSSFQFIYTGSSSGYWNFDAEVRQNNSPVLVDGDLAANGGSVAELDNVQTWTADQHFNSGNPVAALRGISGSYGDLEATGSNWGASIWTIGDSFAGAGAGDTFAPDSSQFGLVWLRGGHASVDPVADEGLYIYRNGALKAAIGRVGANFKQGIYDNGNKLGSNAYGDRTVSTAAPSGGSNGDIWLQVD